ncbi:MAG: hypothetical protein IBJ11_05825 [Phycisphaerales bacterium]|nr:hypothetical protein [Phycisphaerales bacterium]
MRHLTPHLVLLALPAATALAGPAPDVGVAIENGRVVTYAADHTTGQFSPEPARVFKADMTPESGLWFADEPGFFSNRLTIGTRIGFNIRAALRLWTGSAFNPLDPGSEETISLARSFVPPVGVRTSAAGFVAGYDFIAATPNLPPDGLAGFDDHLELLINGPARPGIYLLELELWQADSPGGSATPGSTSLPFWFVLNAGRPEAEHEDAEAYVAAVLVPAPGAGATLAAALFFAARRRR